MAHSHVKTYTVVYVALLILVALTVAVSFLKIGVWSAPVAVAIASTKAVLIVLFFMHIKDETPLVRIFATVGFVWLMLLFVILMGDYTTRHQMNPDAEVSTPV